MTHERPNLKQIRIKKSVCARLDERKSNDDSYTDVIKALLDENERLKERNVELERDKQDLAAMSKALTFNNLSQQGETDLKAVEEAFERIDKTAWQNK